ncbi:MAG: translation factor Sua5, partial [Mesorhizobium sp.]
KIKLVVDGGATPVGLESTIVKIEDGELRLLRPGGIAAEDIEAVVGMKMMRGAAGIEAPGMLASHYAPGASVRLNAEKIGEGEALLAFGRDRAEGWRNAVAVRN